MIWGYVLAVLCLVLLLKFVARKMKWNKLNIFLHKIHIPLGCISILVIIVHLVVTYPVWQMREQLVVYSGILLSIVIIAMAIGYLLKGKLGKIWLKLHRIGAAAIIALLVAHVITYFVDFGNYQTMIASTIPETITAENVVDGTYEGDYSVGYIQAKVKVTVENEKIKDIQIMEHKNEHGKPAEVILVDVLKAQTTDVDTISGATNSSKVLLKTIENALKKGKK